MNISLDDWNIKTRGEKDNKSMTLGEKYLRFVLNFENISCKLRS